MADTFTLDERPRSYINDPRMYQLLRWMTFETGDVSPTWLGKYMPATSLDDEAMVALARFSTDHYVLYLMFVEQFMTKYGSVLDIGSGTGHRSAMLRRYAKSVMCIDANRTALDFAAKMNVYDGMKLYEDVFPDNSANLDETFDYIFAIEVIEHVDPARHDEFIDSAIGLLKPGGLLFLTTPKDENVVRKHPHVGLWSPEDYERFCCKYDGRLEPVAKRLPTSPGNYICTPGIIDGHYFMAIGRG